MSSPIVKPEIPYNGDVPGGLHPGKMCRIQGVTHPNGDRFNINFQVGPNSKPRDDTTLHISVRLNQGYVARNSYKSGSWGDEQGNGVLPIGPAQAFEILVLVDPNHYKVAVNGQHFCEFPHRIPFSDVHHLLIDGDVSITLISWEAPIGPETATQSSKLNVENTQGSPPQQMGGVPQGGPPQQYGGVPQGTYGPPGGQPPFSNYGPQGPYGPPMGGYGPPLPPGAQPESGAENFWEQAQSVLAGAIKSGAAEKLLSGLLSSGGHQQQQPQQGYGYAPQNAQYGIYPQLPQEDGPKPKDPQSDHGPGPVERLLTNFLSGGNNNQQSQQQPPPPTTYQPTNPPYQQPQQPQGGLNLSSLLTSLLSPSDQQGGQSHNQNYSNMGQYSGPPQYNVQPPQNNQQPPQYIPPQPIQQPFSNPQQPPQNNQQPPHSQQQPQHVNSDDLTDVIAGLVAGKGNNNDNRQQPNQIPPQGNPGQQQYGQYPQAPPHSQEQKGPIENLLSGLLSSGGNQQPYQAPHQQPRLPQVGGEGSVGGLGSMGGILQNLAGQILHPKDSNQRQNY